MQSEALRGSQRAKRAPSEPQRGNQRQSDGNQRQSEGNQMQSRGNQRQSDGNRRKSEGNQRQSEVNQRQSGAIRGNQRTIRASESVATGGRFAATVSASSTGAYLMKEAISAHQCPSVAHSGAIARNHAQSRGRTAYPSRPPERAVSGVITRNQGGARRPPERAVSGTITRNQGGAHRLSVPTPRARCNPIRPSFANSAVASSPPTRRNA
jgi:hypothetical protein